MSEKCKACGGEIPYGWATACERCKNTGVEPEAPKVPGNQTGMTDEQTRRYVASSHEPPKHPKVCPCPTDCASVRGLIAERDAALARERALREAGEKMAHMLERVIRVATHDNVPPSASDIADALAKWREVCRGA